MAPNGDRDFVARPLSDWDDALDALATVARRERLLVVLDEFPELVELTPELPRMFRAWWARAEGNTKLRLVVCGSSLRTMEAMQEERAPLFGRFDLSLLVHPFEPHEAALMLSLDDFSGPRWESAFRGHLRRRSAAGEIAPDVVAVGPWWNAAGEVEIDAVVLAGRRRTPVLAGEAKWAKVIDGARVASELRRKAAYLPGAGADLRFALAARDAVRDPGDALVVTAKDVFG